jgi:hypothetical protein
VVVEDTTTTIITITSTSNISLREVVVEVAEVTAVMEDTEVMAWEPELEAAAGLPLHGRECMTTSLSQTPVLAASTALEVPQGVLILNTHPRPTPLLGPRTLVSQEQTTEAEDEAEAVDSTLTHDEDFATDFALMMERLKGYKTPPRLRRS